MLSCYHGDDDMQKVWHLANVSARKFAKALSKPALAKLSIEALCCRIHHGDNLRISSFLLYGLCLLYKSKVGYVLNDTTDLQSRLKVQAALASRPAVEYRHEARQPLLEDDDSFQVADLCPAFCLDPEDVPLEVGRADFSTVVELDSAQWTMARDLELDLDLRLGELSSVDLGSVAPEPGSIVSGENLAASGQLPPQRKRRLVVDTTLQVPPEEYARFQGNYELAMAVRKLKKSKSVDMPVEVGRDRGIEPPKQHSVLELTFHHEDLNEDVFDLSFPELDLSVLRSASSGSEGPKAPASGPADHDEVVLSNVHARFMRYLQNVEYEELGAHRRIQFHHICPLSVTRSLVASSFASVLELSTKSVLHIEGASGAQLHTYRQLAVVI